MNKPKSRQNLASKSGRRKLLSESGPSTNDWKIGGPWHQSPHKVDADGVPLYGRTLLALPPPRRSAALTRPSKKKKAKTLEENKSVGSKPKTSVALAKLESACSRFDRKINTAGLGELILKEMRRGGRLSPETAASLFRWCYSANVRGLKLARIVCLTIFGRVPSEKEIKSLWLEHEENLEPIS